MTKINLTDYESNVLNADKLMAYLGKAIATMFLSLGLWLILAAVLSVFYGETDAVVQSAVQKVKEAQAIFSADDEINKDLQATALEQDFRRNKVKFENMKYGQDVGHVSYGDLTKQHNNTQGIDLKQEDHYIEKESSSYDDSPAAEMERNVATNQWLHEYEESYQDEFVRQFKANALKQGYDVQLNDNLDVIGLRKKKLRKPIRINY